MNKYFYGVAGLLLSFCLWFSNTVVSMKTNSVDSKIYYDNIRYTDNVDFYGVDGLSLQYSGTLQNPGDFYELSFDVINSTGQDVAITECFLQKDDSFIEYRLTYLDGKDVLVGDLLKKGETKHLKYRVLYKNKIVIDTYQFDASFSIRYEQNL